MASDGIVVAALLVLVVLVQCETTFHRGSKLLVILVDGIRYDFPDEDPDYTGFPKMAESGVRAPYLVPVFPSKTTPNVQSAVTGLYPENHGFVDNWLYDPDYEDTFNWKIYASTNVPHWWSHAEPIWITAEKQGLRSALFWWMGCQVEINGFNPSYCRPYNYASINETKEAMMSILRLFENGEMDFIMVYHELIDRQGHSSGTNSKMRKRAMKNIDSLLHWLQIHLEKKRLQNEVNVMVFSGHGMTSVHSSNSLDFIDLTQSIDPSDIKRYSSYGGMQYMQPKNHKFEKVYEALKTVKGLKVYRKEDIPERYHIKYSRTTLPLLIVARKGYFIMSLEQDLSTADDDGEHGYDPLEILDMNGIFFAVGPCFKSGYTSYPLSVVDLYNVMSKVLGIEGNPNNGTNWRTDPMLQMDCLIFK